MQIYNLELQEIPLFRDISAEEIDRFIVSTGAMVKRYGKGIRILKAYEANADIGVVVEGQAQVIAADRFGNETVSHTLERGALFGSTSAILPTTQPGNNTSIDTLSDVIVLWVPYCSLTAVEPELGRIYSIVMKNLLEILCRRNVRMMEKIALLSQKTLRERLILYLLQHEVRQETEKVSVPGRVQLAKGLECNRSALTREIAAMKKDGMLTIGENWLRLHKEKIG